MGFGEDKVVLGQNFLQALQFSCRIIPPVLYTHSFICQWHHIISTIDTIIKQQHSSSCNVAETTSSGLSSQLMVLEYGMKFKLWHLFFPPHCTLSWDNLMLTPWSGQSIFLLDHQTLCSPLKHVMHTSLLAQLTVLLCAGSMHDIHK